MTPRKPEGWRVKAGMERGPSGIGRGDGQKQNAWEPEQGSPILPRKPGKLGLASPLFGEFSGSLGEGRSALSCSGRVRGLQPPQVSELSRSAPGSGSGPGLRGAGSARAAGRHGGTGPAQRSGHPATLRAALAGWSLASDRGEEGAVVLAAGAA